MTAGLRAMLARDPGQPHRVASTLELLFDLVFVVAVSQASGALHHLYEEQHFAEGLMAYAMVFFAVLQAWTNFTWFASAYDTDDWLYRLTTFVQMGGALTMAAGTQPAMLHHDFRVILFGYVIMRLAMASQWVRAAMNDPAYRGTCMRYAIGILIVQVLWVAWVVSGSSPWLWLVVAALDASVSPVAERSKPTSFHPHHIAERYGLFTIIVLGESLLAVANSIIGGLSNAEARVNLIVVAACSLAIVAAMWWIYFDRPQHDRLMTLRRSFFWGYMHYFIFGSAAAFSAGVEVAVSVNVGESRLPHVVAGLTLTIPLAVFLVASWLVLLAGRRDPVLNVGIPVIAVLLVLSAWTRYPLPPSAVLLAAAAALISWRRPAAATTP
jgi:low temperature requirement protein LtrA